MGTQAFEQGANTGESLHLQDLHCRSPAALHGNVGPNYHYGQEDGLLPHPPYKKNRANSRYPRLSKVMSRPGCTTLGLSRWCWPSLTARAWCTPTLPQGTKVNGYNIVKALTTFMKQLKKKRPEMVAREWGFHWDTDPVPTAAVVRTWLATSEVQVLKHPSLFARPGTIRHFLLPESEGGAGQSHPHTDDLQKHLGTGQQDHPRRGIRCCVPAVESAVQEVCEHWRCVC